MVIVKIWYMSLIKTSHSSFDTSLLEKAPLSSHRLCHFIFITIPGPRHVGMFSFHGMEFCKQASVADNHQGILVETFLYRPLLVNILSQFLPTLLFLLIRSHIHNKHTKWLNIFFSQPINCIFLWWLFWHGYPGQPHCAPGPDDIVGSHSHCLLLVYFYTIHDCSFLGISNSLPQTGAIKMIDVWLIFTMLYPFMSVMLHSLAQVNRKQLMLLNCRLIVYLYFFLLYFNRLFV